MSDAEFAYEKLNRRYQELAQEEAATSPDPEYDREMRSVTKGWFNPTPDEWDAASANFYSYGGCPEQKPVKSSGSQQTWDSGAVRDSQDGKLRYDLIDPGFNARLAEQMRKGAEHYGEYNWTKGIPSSRYMASLLRHIEAYRAGARDEDHLAAACFNLMGIMRNEGTDLDDNFDWNASGTG